MTYPSRNEGAPGVLMQVTTILLTLLVAGCATVHSGSDSQRAAQRLVVSVIPSDRVAIPKPTVVADGGEVLVAGTISPTSRWGAYRGHVQVVARTARGAEVVGINAPIRPWPRRAHDSVASFYNARLPRGTIADAVEIEVSYVDETLPPK